MKKLIVGTMLILSAFAMPALERGKEFKKNILATVRIVAPDGMGTGFAIDKRKVITAGHVVAGNKEVEVTFFDEKGKEIKRMTGKVLKAIEEGNFDNDLGLVELPEDAPHYNKVDVAEAELGDEGYTVGGPYGEIPHCIAIGTFSGISSKIPTGILTAMSAPGASGSAVFNSKHQLVGILVSGVPNVCIYYIPDDKIKELLK